MYLHHSLDCIAPAVLKVQERRRQLGFPVHGEEWGSRTMTALGWTIDSEHCEVRVKPDRAWRLYIALEQVMQHPYIDVKVLERLVGHLSDI